MGPLLRNNRIMGNRFLMFLVTILAWMISNPVCSQNSNVPLPKALSGIVWKIDQLYMDTLRIYDEGMDSLRYKFIDYGMVVLSSGEISLSRPYDYNPGTKKITINYQDIPDQTYDVIVMTANILIFRTQAEILTGGNTVLEYRLVPE
jgi:hypothetical protein